MGENWFFAKGDLNNPNCRKNSGVHYLINILQGENLLVEMPNEQNENVLVETPILQKLSPSLHYLFWYIHDIFLYS